MKHTIETISVKTDAKWIFYVNLASVWDGDKSQSHIQNLCEILIRQLKQVDDKLDGLPFEQEVIDDLGGQLFDIIDHFEFLRDLANGIIKKWDDYGFDGNFIEWFDGYLTELYDFGDQKPIDKFNVRRKLLWVNK